MFNRSTPEKILLYKHALAFYKLFWSTDLTIEFLVLNCNTILTTRQTNCILSKSNIQKVGLNALANRLHIINNRIPLNEMNKSFASFKVFCKKEFLTM